MKFIQLPESGRLINLELISMVDHEVIDFKAKAIARLGNGDKLIISDQDAEYLVSVLQDEVYE